MINNLCEDNIIEIFGYLSLKEIFRNTCLVNKLFHDVLHREVFWKSLIDIHYPEYGNSIILDEEETYQKLFKGMHVGYEIYFFRGVNHKLNNTTNISFSGDIRNLTTVEQLIFGDNPKYLREGVKLTFDFLSEFSWFSFYLPYKYRRIDIFPKDRVDESIGHKMISHPFYYMFDQKVSTTNVLVGSSSEKRAKGNYQISNLSDSEIKNLLYYDIDLSDLLKLKDDHGKKAKQVGEMANVRVTFDSEKLQEVQLEGLEKMFSKDIRFLELRDWSYTDKIYDCNLLSYLTHLKNLEVLTLENYTWNINDLNQLKNLRNLYINNRNSSRWDERNENFSFFIGSVDGGGYEKLTPLDLPKLQILSLPREETPPVSLVFCRKLVNLKRIILTHCKCTDIFPLAELPNLRVIDAVGSGIRLKNYFESCDKNIQSDIYTPHFRSLEELNLLRSCDGIDGTAEERPHAEKFLNLFSVNKLKYVLLDDNDYFKMFIGHIEKIECIIGDQKDHFGDQIVYSSKENRPFAKLEKEEDVGEFLGLLNFDLKQRWNNRYDYTKFEDMGGFLRLNFYAKKKIVFFVKLFVYNDNEKAEGRYSGNMFNFSKFGYSLKLSEKSIEKLSKFIDFEKFFQIKPKKESKDD